MNKLLITLTALFIATQITGCAAQEVEIDTTEDKITNEQEAEVEVNIETNTEEAGTMDNELTSETKATDYNSSRSNKNGSGSAFDDDSDSDNIPTKASTGGYIKIDDVKGESEDK
jgi:hypothetical protein